MIGSTSYPIGHCSYPSRQLSHKYLIPMFLTSAHFCYPPGEALGPWLPIECQARIEQTLQLHRVILVFGGCKGNFVCCLAQACFIYFRAPTSVPSSQCSIYSAPRSPTATYRYFRSSHWASSFSTSSSSYGPPTAPDQTPISCSPRGTPGSAPTLSRSKCPASKIHAPTETRSQPNPS